MTQNKSAKNNAKNNAKKTAPKNAPQKKETAMTKKTVAKKSVAQKTANPKPAPKNAQKETRNANDYVVASIQIKIDRKQHTVAKRFAADKTPVAAVVAIMNTTRLPHIICWTKNAKSAAAHCRRVNRQYVGSAASIETRYDAVIVLPVEIRAATDDDLLARATTDEDRTWIRVNRDARGLNKTANSDAANAANAN